MAPLNSPVALGNGPSATFNQNLVNRKFVMTLSPSNSYQSQLTSEELQQLQPAALGLAIFDEDWRPEVTRTDGIPGLEPATMNNEPPTAELLVESPS